MKSFPPSIQAVLTRLGGHSPGSDRVEPKQPPSCGTPVCDTTIRLMALRDDAMAASEDASDSQARTLRAFTRKIEEILVLDQVEPIDDTGSFNPTRHQVVGCIDTEDARLHYRLASTVRSGYIRAGTLLRRQDVLLYLLPEYRATTI